MHLVKDKHERGKELHLLLKNHILENVENFVRLKCSQGSSDSFLLPIPTMYMSPASAKALKIPLSEERTEKIEETGATWGERRKRPDTVPTIREGGGQFHGKLVPFKILLLFYAAKS